MRAILLSAGFGKRLLPYTSDTPKCLIPIKNKPLLEIWLEKLSSLGVNAFLINTHYMHEKVEEFVMNSKFKREITIVREEHLLGTSGTLSSNLDFYGNEDGLLVHTDNYCEDDLSSFVQKHLNRDKQCLLSMLTFRTKVPKQSGIVSINDNGVIIDYEEKPHIPKGNLANGAVFILSREFLKQYRSFHKNCFDFSADVIPHYIGKIMTYETKKKYLDIGTPENYLSVK